MKNFFYGYARRGKKGATVDTCFGLFGPHQHGVAKSKS